MALPRGFRPVMAVEGSGLPDAAPRVSLLEALQAARLQRQAGRAELGTGVVATNDPQVSNLDLVHRLEAAVHTGAIEPRYQPVFDLVSGAIVGADALAAWPDEGLAGLADEPLHELAESRGMLTALARQLVSRVVADFASGPPAVAGWWVTLPLGPEQLGSAAFAEHLAMCFDSAAFPVSRAVIEIHEADVVEGLTNGGIARLMHLGLQFSIADFGVGAVSPAQLRELPVAFVRVNLKGLSSTEPGDATLLGWLVATADALGIRVLAEGIETDDHLHLVHQAGIGLVQGYRWGTAGTVAKLVSTWARPT